MLSYFKLIRPVNLLILAVTQYLVLFFLIRPIMVLNQCDIVMSQIDFALFVLSNVLLAAAGYAINDFYDVKIDTINKPSKNVVINNIPAKSANTFSFVLNGIAVALGFYCSYKVGFIKLGFLPLVVALALYFYSLKYKRQLLIGNMVVALLIAYSILVVWLFEFFALKTDAKVFAAMMNNFSVISNFVIGFAVFAFLITFIREIIKDTEDIEGDQADGCNTFPIKYGIPKTKKFILGFIIFTMFLLAFAQTMLYENYLIASCYLIVVQGMYVFLAIKLFSAKEKSDFHFLSIFAKMIMIAGLLVTQLLYISF